MPLNKTGKKIMKSMKDQYGSKEGEQVFYASKNKGILPKVEKASMGKSFGPPPKRGPQPQGMKKGGFDPEGSGYDYKRAKELDYKRDDKGHLPTRDYKTGMILKGKKHETFSKGVQEDFKKGYQLKKKGDRYYTIKSKREFNKLREKASLPHVSQSLKTGGPSQGMKKAFLGGMSNYLKINKFLDSVVYPTAFKITLATQNQKRRKQAQKQKEQEKQKLSGYTPKKEETGITTKETMGLKTGGFGCPHRENGVKSDIKGISNIQVKGKKFIGVK